MNTMSLAIITIATSLVMLLTAPVVQQKKNNNTPLPIERTTEAWEQQAINWLIEAQSPNGGWGAGSHSYQNVKDPHAVQTDPATTAFAALALLKSGGPLESNPYKKQITNALDRILKDIETRPDNGRITSLSGTQPQVKLGIHIDASMALQFLTDIREQINDPAYEKKIDQAADVCIHLIQGSQNENGGWAGGGWAPVLQSAMANNALERAEGRYAVDQKALEKSRQYQANNIKGEDVMAGDAAGIPLYAAASAQRATSFDARKVETMLEPGKLSGYSSGKIKKDEIISELEEKGLDRDKAEKLATSYEVNMASTKSLQSDDIWNGFGNNGGEEYLSYMMTSESLAQQGQEDWMKWRKSIEPKFRQSQNPNGSWSGQHCITSPVFCTAAIIQTWNAGNTTAEK